MSRATWECKICKEKFTAGKLDVIDIILKHAENSHSKEYYECYAQRKAYENELMLFVVSQRRKYPRWNESAVSLFEEKTKPAKKWICPNCKQEMSYHDKYFHERNAKKYCKLKQVGK